LALVKILPLQIHRRIRSRGYLRFYLENGQVWDQTQPARVRHLGQESPDMLVIKNAAMGSFLARVNGKAPKMRVRRVE